MFPTVDILMREGGNTMGEPGLCQTCQHVKRTETKRGSVFYLCLLAQSDARLRKYPPLPVRQCHGYRPRQERHEPSQDLYAADTGSNGA